MTGLRVFARLAFVNGDGRSLVETFGKQAGKERRHVLDDDNRHGKIGGNCGDDSGEGIGAAGGGTDREEFDVRPGAFADGDRLGGCDGGKEGFLAPKPCPHSPFIFGSSSSLMRSMVTSRLPVLLGLVT